MKTFPKTLLYIFVTILLFGMAACSGKDDQIANNSGIEQDGSSQTDSPQVSIDWNSSMSDVEASMANYTLRSKEADFLSYETNTNTFVSYKFKNDALIASAVMAPSDNKLETYINGYNYVGDIGNSRIYDKEDNNTVIMNYAWNLGNTNYNVMGFAPKSVSTNLYEHEKSDDINSTPLTLEAIESGTISFKNRASGIVIYRIDDASDMTIGAGTTEEIPVTAGQKVRFYGDNATYKYSNISSTADFYVYGNIMSLVNSNNFAADYTLTGENTFENLFENNTHLKNHPSKSLVLPATTLTDYCYHSMFSGCTGLTSAPALPAKTMKSSCYGFMFYKCTSLTTAPDLPATTLDIYCYNYMFANCTSLTTAPQKLPATSLKMNCYGYMFYNCTSLTTAPELPARTVARWAYNWMFRNCTSLKYVKCLATSFYDDECTEDWLYNVPSTGTFVKKSGVSWSSGSSGIPYGWTVKIE